MRDTAGRTFGLISSALVLSVGVSGCVTTSPETKAKIWGQGRVSLPTSLARSSECRSGPIHNLSKNCSGKKLPAVVFLHGCAGLGHRQFAHMDMFAQLGYPVFAPSSFSRPGRTRSCGRFSPLVLTWRLEEIEIALEKLKTLSWVDQSKLILVGFSEGGIAVANYDGNKFRVIIGMGFGCDRRSFLAPSNIAILQINGKNDTEVTETALCSSGGRQKFKAVYVDAGHAVSGDPNTANIINNFLDETL